MPSHAPSRHYSFYFVFVAAMLMAGDDCRGQESAQTEPLLAGSQLLLDFEYFPGPDELLGTEDDQPTPSCNSPCYDLSTEFRGQRVIFESGTLSQSATPFFPDQPAENHFVTLNPMSFLLFRPAYSVLVDSYSEFAIQIAAYDLDNQLVAAATFDHLGSENQLRTVELHSPVPFRKVILIAADCPVDPTVVPSCDQVLHLDNLRLGFEPGSIFFDSFESGDWGRWQADFGPSGAFDGS